MPPDPFEMALKSIEKLFDRDHEKAIQLAGLIVRVNLLYAICGGLAAGLVPVFWRLFFEGK